MTSAPFSAHHTTSRSTRTPIDFLSQSYCLSTEFKSYFSDALFYDLIVRIPHPDHNNVDMKTHRFILASKSDYFKRSLLLKAVEEGNTNTPSGQPKEQQHPHFQHNASAAAHHGSCFHDSNGTSGHFSPGRGPGNSESVVHDRRQEASLQHLNTSNSNPAGQSFDRIITFPLPVQLIPSFLLFLDFAYTSKTMLTIDNVWNAYHVACILESCHFQSFCEKFLVSFLEDKLEQSEKVPIQLQDSILMPDQLHFIVQSIHKLQMKNVQQWLVNYLEEANRRQSKEQMGLQLTQQQLEQQRLQNENFEKESQYQQGDIPIATSQHQQFNIEHEHNLSDTQVRSRLHRRRSTIDILQHEQQLIQESDHSNFTSSFAGPACHTIPDEMDTTHDFQNFQFPPSVEEPLQKSNIGSTTQGNSVHRLSNTESTSPDHEFSLSHNNDSPSETSLQHDHPALFTDCDTLVRSPESDTQHTLKYFLSHSIAAIASYMKSERATIFLFQSEKRSLHSLAAISDKEIAIAPHEGLAGLCHQTNKTLLINNTASDSSFCSRVDLETGFKTHSVLCAPILPQKSSTGQKRVSPSSVSGVIQVLNHVEGHYKQNDEMRLSHIAQFMAHCIELFSQAISQSEECVLVSPSKYHSMMNQAPFPPQSDAPQECTPHLEAPSSCESTEQIHATVTSPDEDAPLFPPVKTLPELKLEHPGSRKASTRTNSVSFVAFDPASTATSLSTKKSRKRKNSSPKIIQLPLKKQRFRNSATQRMREHMGHFKVSQESIVFHTVHFDNDGNCITKKSNENRADEQRE
mmetsp:Transcript_758/g.2529  ORF Transcript_758/g.2529 Transcript_758/m.2529 type:complete len:799 (+) Transcript_758:39-2435(+)